MTAIDAASPMNGMLLGQLSEGVKQFFPGARSRRLVFFTRQLAGFIRNHVPILKALQAIEAQESDRGFRLALETVQKDVKSGQPLSNALKRHPLYFAPFYIAMVRAGEESGALEQTLRILAEHLKKDERTLSAVRQALIYPSFLLCAGFGAIVFMLTQVVPKLSGLLRTLHQDLPWATRLVIWVGEGFGRFWALFVIIPAVLVLMARRNPSARWDASDALLDMPGVGEWLMKSEAARYARTVGLALQNGVSFVYAMEVAAPLLRFQRMRARMFRVQEAVRKGGFFGQALKANRAMPPFAAEMIAVGEESGFLQDTLLNVAEVYDEEVEDAVKTFLSLLEPVLILVVGGLMAAIVLSMMMPVFDIELTS